MIKFKNAAILLIMLLVLFLGFKLFRFFQIDSCLDAGGKWDYEKNECVT